MFASRPIIQKKKFRISNFRGFFRKFQIFVVRPNYSAKYFSREKFGNLEEKFFQIPASRPKIRKNLEFELFGTQKILNFRCETQSSKNQKNKFFFSSSLSFFLFFSKFSKISKKLEIFVVRPKNPHSSSFNYFFKCPRHLKKTEGT